MNVKELKKELEKIPDDLEVILQTDQEGNGFHALRIVDSEAVAIKDGYEYDVYDLNWSADDASMDEEDWEEFKKENEKVVVLAP